MEIHMSYDDNDAQSYVSSIGPQLGQGGRVVRPAQIVVYPFGPDPLAAAAGKVPLLKPGMVALNLSLDEAEALAEKLIDVVREARNDKYSATDEEFEHWLNEEEKRHAWGVLMADDELSDRDD